MNARNKSGIGLAVVGMLLLPAGTATAAIPMPYSTDANTVALYHFDGENPDDAGMLADSSGNGYNLTPNGVDPLGSSATPALLNAWDAEGAFEGTFVSGPTVAAGTDWTVETLLNTRSFVGAVPGERRNYLVFDSGEQFGYRPDGFFQMIIGGTSQSSIANQVALEEWIHIAVTYDASSGEVTIFKNGTDISGGSSAAPVSEGLSGTFRLGHNAGNFDQWFDEVRISNTIRTFEPFVISEPATVIPEPATVMLLAAGGLFVGTRNRRQGRCC